MTIDLSIRPATAQDATALQAIYAPYVLETAISFETQVPDPSEMARRIETYQPDYGYWVAQKNDGQILGYAYGSTYRPRPAYRFTAEVSVYVDRSMPAKGVGRALYGHMIPDLKARGYHTLIGVVTQPNAPSEGFHRSMGFECIGITRQVGRKFDVWHDIALYQKMLA